MSAERASEPGGAAAAGKTRRKKVLGRERRMLRHSDFERAYKQGRRLFSASMTIFYRPRGEETHGEAAKGAQGPRIGFTVGKALGGAVDRNRIRRRLRAAVRQHVEMLTGETAGGELDIVMHAKKGALTQDFSAITSEVEKAFLALSKNRARHSEQNPGTRRPEAAQAQSKERPS